MSASADAPSCPQTHPISTLPQNIYSSGTVAAERRQSCTARPALKSQNAHALRIAAQTTTQAATDTLAACDLLAQPDQGVIVGFQDGRFVHGQRAKRSDRYQRECEPKWRLQYDVAAAAPSVLGCCNAHSLHSSTYRLNSTDAPTLRLADTAELCAKALPRTVLFGVTYGPSRQSGNSSSNWRVIPACSRCAP